jgi:hypothetical protein
MMPLFFKVHSLVTVRVGDKLSGDKALLQEMFDRCLTEFKAGKPQLLILLSHLCERGAKPTEDLWNLKDVSSMEASSFGRSGRFAQLPNQRESTGIQLEAVPDDVFVEIIQRCQYDTDIGALASTCKALNTKISALSPTVWKKLFERFNISESSSWKGKQRFTSEVSHRRAFRVGWDLVKVRRAQYDKSMVSADSLLNAIPNRDGLFSMSSEGSFLSIIDVREEGKIAKNWTNAIGTFYHPTFSSDGNNMFTISREVERTLLCVGSTDPADDSALKTIQLDQVTFRDEEDINPPFGEIQLIGDTGLKILQNPGVLFDLGDGHGKHVGTLNWPKSFDATHLGEGMIETRELATMDRADWSKFAYHNSNPNQIVARYLYYSWLHDTRVSYDPVLTFPTTPKNGLERQTLGNPLQFKTEHIVRLPFPTSRSPYYWLTQQTPRHGPLTSTEIFWSMI